MEGLSATLKEEFLTCTICFEIYTEPQSLPCLHTFCKSCLQNFLKTCSSKGPYKCPVCRREFSNKKKSIKPNFHLRNMIDAVNQSKSLPQIRCSFCNLHQRNEEAVSRCLTCLDYLCKTCTKSRHTFTRQTLNHRIVPLTDIKDGMYESEIRSNQKMNCPKHVNEVLRMHCIQCRLCVCVECIILDHKNHDFQSFSDARKEKEFEIQKAIEDIKHKQEETIQNKSMLSIHAEDISEKKRRIRNQINKTCTAAFESIREIETKAQNELDDAFKPAQEKIQLSINKCSTVCERIEESIHISENLLVNGNDLELLSLYDDIIKRTSDLKKECDSKDLYLPIAKMTDLQITWKESEMKLILEKIQSETIADKSGKMHETESGTKNTNVETSTHALRENHPFEEKCPTRENNSKPINVLTNATYKIDLIESLSLRETTDDVKPVFSSVVWINKETIAVVDKENEKIKVLNLNNRTSTSHIMPGALTVSPYEKGISCRSTNFCMKVFEIPFKEIKSLNVCNVTCVLSSTSYNPNLKWMTKRKLYSRNNKGVSYFSFYEADKKPVVLGRPNYAFHCLDGSYVVSDKKNNCVYFISSEGKITMEIDHYPGSIAQNNIEHIFISDFENGSISVFDYTGKRHSEIKIGKWLYSPRSISIHDDKLLVATKFKILLFKLKLNFTMFCDCS